MNTKKIIELHPLVPQAAVCPFVTLDAPDLAILVDVNGSQSNLPMARGRRTARPAPMVRSSHFSQEMFIAEVVAAVDDVRTSSSLELAPAPSRDVAPKLEMMSTAGVRGSRRCRVAMLMALAILAVLGVAFAPTNIRAAVLARAPRSLAALKVQTARTQAKPALVAFDVTPAGARLVLDGVAMTSDAVELAPGSTHRVSAKARGYEAKEVLFTAEGQRLRIELRRHHERANAVAEAGFAR